MKVLQKYSRVAFIFVLIAVIVSSFVVAVNVFNPTAVLACRDQGCNASFWKDHTDLWVGHNPGDTLRTVFSEADKYQLGDITLLAALGGFKWGSCPFIYSSLVAWLLLREGVAASLNVSNPEIDYHLSGTRVVQMVNDALASGNTLTMLSTLGLLIRWNNAGCPFCHPPVPSPYQ